jgi:hypothetical protein
MNTNGVVTGTVATNYQSQGAYLTTAMASNRGTDFVQATAGFAGTNVSGTIASNGISVSVGNYLTTAMASNRGTDFVQATAAFAGTNASGTIASNGVSVSVNAQSAQPVAASASNGSFNFSTLKFVETNGITWATSTDGIRGSVNTAYIPLANSTNFAGVGESTTTTSGTDIKLTVDTNGVNIAVPPYITTYAAQSVQPVAASASNGSFNFSTLKFVEGFGVTWATQANGIQASVQTDYIPSANSSNFAGVGETVGTIAGTDLGLTVNTNGVSIAQPKFITTAMQSGASTQFVQANANFFGTNASGTIASNAISISVNAGGPGGGGVAISAGTNSTSTGTVVFSNSNGVSFGMNTNGVVTATVKTDYLTSQSVQTQASGNIAGIGLTTTTTAGTAVVGTNSTNGLSLGIPAYITTYAAQTNQTVASGNIAGTGFTSTTTAGTAIVGTNSTNGLSLGVPAFITTYVNDLTSGRAGTGFTSTTTAGTAITAALGTNGLSMAVPQFITTARASTDAIGLNTAQSNVTWTVNSSGLSLDARGYAGTGTSATNASVTLNSNGLAISVASPSGGGAGTNTALALTNLTGTLSVNTNGVSLSLNNLDDHFSAWSLVGNTVGGNSYSLSTEGPLVLEGGSNVTLSGNSNTIVISAGGGTTNQTGPNIAAGGATATSGTVIFSNSNNITFGLNGQTMTASYADFTESVFFQPDIYATTVGAPINGSASIIYCPMDHNLSASRFDVMVSASVATNNNNSSAGVLWSLTAVIYTLNGQTLSSASSITTASQWTWSSNVTGSATGNFFLSAPLSLSAAADKYWMGVALSTRATGLTGAATTSLANTLTMFGVGSAQIGAFSAREPGANTANSNGWFIGMGMYSGTTNFSTIGLSNLTQQGTNAQRANIAFRMRNL